MRKPPFEWAATDRARLCPGYLVVRVLESIVEAGKFHATLLRVVKIYGDTVFFRCGNYDPMIDDEPNYFGVPLENLDPESITTPDELARAEAPKERKAVN